MPFKIIRNDITKVKASAIVNTANPLPEIGSGTDSAIYEAAGKERLLEARRKIGPIEPGQAAITRGFGLPASYIIHTVGPVWAGGGHQEQEILADCYRSSLALAVSRNCTSIAFPLISTGNYGFPKDLALQTAIGVFTEFLANHEMEILLVVFDKDSLALSENMVGAIDSYIDERYVGDQAFREYSGRLSRRRSGTSVFHNLSFREETEREDFFQPFSYLSEESDADSSHYDSFRDEDFYYEDSRPVESAKESLPSHSPKNAARRPSGYGSFPDLSSPSHADRRKSLRREKRRRTLDGLADQLGESFQQMLFRLIDEKNMTDVEVYKRANIDKRLFSKIRSNSKYQPKKSTALALAIALRLNLDETRDLLSRAGYALSPSSLSDLIVSFFIENEIWDVITIDIALFEHDEAPLTG